MARSPDGFGAAVGRPVAVAEVLTTIASGGMVVVADERPARAVGGIVMAAQHVTAGAIGFMSRHAGGWISLALQAERCDVLGLHALGRDGDRHRSAACFTHTIDARCGVTSGGSAADRAYTMRLASNPESVRADFVKGGHVTPRRVASEGIFSRLAPGEAAIDLPRLAGCSAAGVLCEILDDAGSLATLPEIRAFSTRHALPLVTLAALLDVRRRTEPLLHRAATASLPTPWGTFAAVAYASPDEILKYLALVHGDVAGGGDVRLDVHDGCLAGEIFGATNCACRRTLDRSLQLIAAEGGVLIHAANEDRVGRFVRLIRAQDDAVSSCTAVGSDNRIDDRSVAEILSDLGVRRARLLGRDDAGPR
jgi:3,4-dihydroxy 2-butanone 4-phosphate synthase/GTP cyclohydrolase II